MFAKSLQLCPTLCDRMDCNPPGSPCPQDSPRQEYWSGLACPLPGDLLNPEIESTSPGSPTLTGRFSTTSTTWEAHPSIYLPNNFNELFCVTHNSLFPSHNTQFSSVQLPSRVWLFGTPWSAEHQASLSITNSQSLLKLMSIELVMRSNHLNHLRPFSFHLQSLTALESFQMS